MALNIGELVGMIRADDSGWRSGLDAARLRMRGLQRDAEGRLRDIRGQFISEGDAAGRGLADGIRAHAELAAPAVKKVGIALGALGAGVPAVAAATAALGGLAAGAASAGLAVKAFQLAAQPQLEKVTEVTQLAEEAQQAAASGAADAAEKQKAYTDALKDLPPATQDTAKAFIGLKKDYKGWSDEMSATTMPVFTKGIGILRDLLPTLTPFVQAAAKAFSGFLDSVAKGVKSARFKEWADDMANAAGPALSNFLTVVKNFAVGFGGLMQAFAASSDGTTGGLVAMSEAFAKWGASLKGSEGFATFLEMAREGGQTLGTLASAAVRLLSALSPIIGVTAQLATGLAKIINALPPEALLAIGTAWAAIALGIKAYTLYTTLAATATRVWAAAQGLLNTVMAANPVGIVIAAIVALVAVLVVAYQKSETFRNLVQSAWSAIQSAVLVAVGGIRAAISWFGTLPGLFSGWFGQAKDWVVAKLAEMVAWVAGVPGRVSAALAGLLGALRDRAASAGSALVAATRQKVAEAIAWVRGLPGRARSALGNLGGVLAAAGRALIRGFVNGITSMVGSVRNAAKSVVSAARNFFPFSPAKEGPFSGKGYTLHSGRALAGDFGRGITDQMPYLRRVMDSLPTPAVPTLAAPGIGALPGGPSADAAAGRGPVELVVQEGAGGRVEALLTHIIRETVAVKGGGDVQRAFGRR